MRDKYKRFWMADKLSNIARDDNLMQGDWDIKSYLRNLKSELNCYKMVDYGCGYGRLFSIFKDCPSLYFGVDLNPFAIAEAKKRYPAFQNRFCEVDIDSNYAVADMYLAFTVFLHMDDKTLSDCLRRIGRACQKNLVVIETLGREWRNKIDGSDESLPVFNRDKQDYVDLVKPVGFELIKHDSFLNPHYARQERYIDRNCNTDVLVFGKV